MGGEKPRFSNEMAGVRPGKMTSTQPESRAQGRSIGAMAVWACFVKWAWNASICIDHIHSNMAESAPVVPSDELLEWPKKDKRRFLHAVYRVGDLDRTIKFYTECFGMKLLRKRDIPEEKYSNAFLGFGPEESHFVVELTYNYGVDKYDIGTGFGHFAIATPDVYKMVEEIRAKGGSITREPGGPTPEPLCQVMLRVGDLDRSIKFYEKVQYFFDLLCEIHVAV
ncbi:hypothetical protein F0562_014336 [Nyssa sinensis]|uniref:lactoylglutathione lyase n=1 Tax=Nyssa sinensis TaxID=561372 RepID=A0A5J4ZND3_9ASTE|nr:hypothetical protein F0562_014336 [Nyssa sinensis]